MGRQKKSGGLVYSTAQGRLCPGCGQPVAQCRCKQQGSATVSDGIVRVGRETKGRKGKGVTTVRGIPLPEEALKAYAAELKKRCGSGGALKQGVVEIQGDHRDLLVEELGKRGWTVKRSGG